MNIRPNRYSKTAIRPKPRPGADNRKGRQADYIPTFQTDNQRRAADERANKGSEPQ